MPVLHASGAPAYGLRLVAAGRVVAYSGDTEWTNALLELAADADLFICEAYTFDRPIKYHLDYRTLERQRARLNCRRLVLTHLGPQMLQHLGAETAEDGLTIRLGE